MIDSTRASNVWSSVALVAVRVMMAVHDVHFWNFVCVAAFVLAGQHGNDRD